MNSHLLFKQKISGRKPTKNQKVELYFEVRCSEGQPSVQQQALTERVQDTAHLGKLSLPVGGEMGSRGQGSVSQGSRAAAPTQPDPRRSGAPVLWEGMALLQDQTLHSWHTDWSSPQCHRSPFSMSFWALPPKT